MGGVLNPFDPRQGLGPDCQNHVRALVTHHPRHIDPFHLRDDDPFDGPAHHASHPPESLFVRDYSHALKCENLLGRFAGRGQKGDDENEKDSSSHVVIVDKW